MMDVLKTAGLCLLIIILSLAYGYQDGVKAGIEQAELKAAREAQAVEVATRDLQARLDRQASAAAVAETARQTAAKEIRRETERIIERPVYRTICVDADGLHVLDQAADISNGTWANAKSGDHLAASADAPAGTAKSQTPGNTQIGMMLSSSVAVEHMTAADCFQSMIDLYETAGQIRAQLIGLQAQVKLTQAPQDEAAQP